jgi:hypothetical protein
MGPLGIPRGSSTTMKGSKLTAIPIPRQVVAALGALAIAITGLVLFTPKASATSAACGNTPRCFGVLSNQALPLEIDTNVSASQVHAGTPLVGHTPVFSTRGDWHVARFGMDRKFRWAPNGVNSHLCITAVSDVPRSRPRLEPCVSGTAGSSHQLWKALNIIDHGFRVYQNEANGLVLTIAGTASGSQVQIRSMGLGTGANKNFVLNKPF